MKKTILVLAALVTLVSITTYAQDTTRHTMSGIRFSADMPITHNASLTRIQNKLVQTGLNADGVGDLIFNFAISSVRDGPKWMTETRLIGTLTSEDGPVVGGAIQRGRLYGFGIGVSEMYKVISTRRFIAGVVGGYDAMWYRLSLLPVDRDNVLLANIARNPAVYNPIRFRHGSYLNLQGGIEANLRVYWFKKAYEEIRFGGRVGYQLPFLWNKQWELNDGTVADLPSFRANMLYYQFGLTFFPKKQKKKP